MLPKPFHRCPSRRGGVRPDSGWTIEAARRGGRAGARSRLKAAEANGVLSGTAARLWGVSRDTMRGMIERAGIEPVEVHGRWRVFSLEELRNTLPPPEETRLAA